MAPYKLDTRQVLAIVTTYVYRYSDALRVFFAQFGYFHTKSIAYNISFL